MMTDNQVPLREYLERLIAETHIQATTQVAGLEKRLDQRAELIQRATDARLADTKDAQRTATAELNERLTLLNELRAGVLPREAFDEYVKASETRYHTASTAIHARIDELRDRIASVSTDVAKGPPELPALATKVEADVGERITRREYESKHELLIAEIGRVRQDVAQLATQVALGPPDLPKLAASVAGQAGAARGGVTIFQIMQGLGVLTLMIVGILVTLVIQGH